MRTPGLIAFDRTLLILVFVLSTPVHAETAIGVEKGDASYYADSLHGNKTASGEPYDKDATTEAHRTLPFGTRVKVTYQAS